jgi:hypothetical protein
MRERLVPTPECRPVVMGTLVRPRMRHRYVALTSKRALTRMGGGPNVTGYGLCHTSVGRYKTSPGYCLEYYSHVPDASSSATPHMYAVHQLAPHVRTRAEAGDKATRNATQRRPHTDHSTAIKLRATHYRASSSPSITAKLYSTRECACHIYGGVETLGGSY